MLDYTLSGQYVEHTAIGRTVGLAKSRQLTEGAMLGPRLQREVVFNA